MSVPYIRMIRLTDDDGSRVNAPIEATRAFRFLSFFRIFSYEFLSFSLIVALFPTLIVAHHAPHESHISPRDTFFSPFISRHAVDKIEKLIDDARLTIP